MLDVFINKCFEVVKEYKHMNSFKFASVTAHGEDQEVLGSLFMDEEYNIYFWKNGAAGKGLEKQEPLSCNMEQFETILKSAYCIATDIIRAAQ